MGFLSLLPIIIAVGLALYTRHAVFSLLCGVFCAALLLNGYDPISSIIYVLDPLILDSLASRGNIKVIVFSLLIGAMVELMRVSGGTQALVGLFIRVAKSRRMALVGTWFAGLTVFFDDYANCLIVGSTMKPATDRSGISREKLAYLVDSTAAPVATLALISTWIAYEVSLMDHALNTQTYHIEPMELRVQEAPDASTKIHLYDPKKQLTAPQLTLKHGDNITKGLAKRSKNGFWTSTVPQSLGKDWKLEVKDSSGFSSSIIGSSGQGGSQLIALQVEDKRLTVAAPFEYEGNRYQPQRIAVIQAHQLVENPTKQVILQVKSAYSSLEVIDADGRAVALVDNGSSPDERAGDGLFTAYATLSSDQITTFKHANGSAKARISLPKQTASQASLLWDESGLRSMPVNAYSFFLEGLPYRFYPILALVFAFCIAVSCRDFGPMLQAEQQFTATSSPEEEEPDISWAKLAVAIIPLILLVGVTGIDLYTQGLAKAKPGAALFEIIGEASGSDAMLKGGLSAILSGMLLARLTGTSLDTIQKSIGKGMLHLLGAISILTLAWSLGDAIKLLETANYLVSTLQGSVSPALLPALVFVLAAAISFATGTSFGTMGTLMPLALPLAIQLGAPHEIVVAVGSAVLSGATWGDHCSPISDTTILSSAGTGCDHAAHVRTQLPYALSAGLIALLLCSVPVGYGAHWALCLLAGAVGCIAIVWGFGKKAKPENAI